MDKLIKADIILALIVLLILVIFMTVIKQNNYSYQDETKFNNTIIKERILSDEEQKAIDDLYKPKISIQIQQVNSSQAPQTLTKTSGVYYYNGKKETWYSSRVLYHYRTCEWQPDDEGFYRTAQGYYVVASTDYPQGTIISISKGTAQVLDAGCDHGVIDVYTQW